MRHCDTLSLKLADAIDQRRREINQTQLRVSKAAGMTPSMVSRLMDGGTARTASYARLADAVDCDILITLRPRHVNKKTHPPQKHCSGVQR